MQDNAKLIHLVYVSKAIDNLSKQNMSDILSSSQRNNDRMNITGILVFSQGKFMQFLEGSEFNITQTFEVIKNDYRHHSVDIIRQRKISNRQFEDWHMRLTETEEISEESGIVFDKLFSANDMTLDANKLALESNSWLLAFKYASTFDMPSDYY